MTFDLMVPSEIIESKVFSFPVSHCQNANKIEVRM